MGGKLFNLPRMPRAAYLEREAAVRACLDDILPGAYRIPRYYGDKADFGDMDVIVVARDDQDAVRERIVGALAIREVKRVGHVYSTAFRGLQTDFFHVPERYLDSTYNFMSFNDLGNLIGKIARRFDLKYGEHGLSYVFRREAAGHYKSELEITQDMARICAFLGLDYGPWARGFASLEALFAWVVASPCFSVAPYLDDDARGAMRERKQERTTIARFVDYLRVRGVTQRPALGPERTALSAVSAAFPEADLLGAVAREEALAARAATLAARFNGKRVMRLCPALAGAALGEFIVAFRRSIDDFDGFVLAASEADIDARIVAFAASRARGAAP